jgi:Skp family chaperone for outer membrane proteins
MTRMMIALFVGTLFVGLQTPSYAAQAAAGRTGTAAPATQTAPRPATPAGQTPPRPAAPAAQAPPTATPAPAGPVPGSVPFPADAKVGYVNMQYIVNESQLGKSGQDKVKALVDRQNTDRAAKNQEIQKLQQEISSGASVLSQPVLAQKNSDLDRLTRQAQFDEQQRQADLQNLQDQLLDEFSQKVLPIVEQVRAEKNLWIIFTGGEGSNIAAIHPGLDLSAEVIKRLDSPANAK